jgi:ubiquinone/menaquinone biosynthesis C-methylase UbiE
VRGRYALMETKEKTIWYEDDLFWQTFESVLFNAKKLESATQEIDHVVELLSLQSGDKVLDLCCGVGRHSLELARRGFEATGLDRTQSYLERAQTKAQDENLKVDFVLCDARRFCAIEEFDAVINLYTAFGYFEEPSDDKRVLLNAYASLRPGGKLLIETMSKEILARIFQPRQWHEYDGRILLQQSQLSDDFSWIENHWILLEDGRQKEFTFSHRLYCAAELKNLLRRCGFRSAEAFGDLEGSPYDHQAKRLIVLGTK